MLEVPDPKFPFWLSLSLSFSLIFSFSSVSLPPLVFSVDRKTITGFVFIFLYSNDASSSFSRGTVNIHLPFRKRTSTLAVLVFISQGVTALTVTLFYRRSFGWYHKSRYSLTQLQCIPFSLRSPAVDHLHRVQL